MYEFTPADDARPAEWVSDALRGFRDVRSIVPAGFEAYARVFHPASARDTPVRWSTVAEANGRIAHPTMQWPAITGTWQTDQAPLWDNKPYDTLPHDIAVVLARVLAPHTATPHRCWFAVWEGYGYLPDTVRTAPSFIVPHVRMHLFRAPVGAIVTSFGEPPWYQFANLWWPDDRAWCVASEIDLDTTYVGGSAECIAAVVGAPELEAMAVEPTDGVASHDDPINPLPPSPS